MESLRRQIREVPNFPKDGILFRDITPALACPRTLCEVVEHFVERYRNAGITHVLGIESRGFIVGTPVAVSLGCGFVPARKPGKLPRAVLSARYELEYGLDELQLHQDALKDGDRVVILDDLIATGGTASAAAELVLQAGASVYEVGALIELTGLSGRARVAPHRVHTLLTY